MGRTKEAEKVLRPAIEYLLKENCKKIILGCTELPIAVFAYKSFKKANTWEPKKHSSVLGVMTNGEEISWYIYRYGHCIR